MSLDWTGWRTAEGLLLQQNTQPDLSRFKLVAINISILKHIYWRSCLILCFFLKNTYLCILEWMRHTSICLFLVPIWFGLGFSALSTSLSGCILIPFMRLHTVYLTLCFLAAHLEHSPWRELERTPNPKANSAPFHGKGKTKGKCSISEPLLCVWSFTALLIQFVLHWWYEEAMIVNPF